MSVFDLVFGTKKNNPRDDIDWDVYNQDFKNGMTWGEQEKKRDCGGYNKGIATPSNDYGRIDNVEYYDLYVKYMGKTSAENARKLGWFMNK